MQRAWKYYTIVLLVVLIDQLTKLWVHFNMEMGYLGQIKVIGDWFKIHYTLNPGMAFGIKIGFRYGKLILTLVRIVFSLVITRYIWQWSQKPYSRVQLLSWSLILGGAIGNVIDSVFYGVCLNNAVAQSPMNWFHGQVIDMIYINVLNTTLPTWIPLFGGQYVSVFPICNIADVAILVGVTLLLWHRQSGHEALQEAHLQQHQARSK